MTPTSPWTRKTRWLAVCGQRKWVVVTKDLAIRRNPAEIKALDGAKVHAIFLYGQSRPMAALIENLRQALVTIETLMAASAEPVHVVVRTGGVIAVVGRPPPG